VRRILVAALCLVLVAIGVSVAALYGEISTLLEERRAAMSSSIFSAPHRIRTGDDLERSRLVGRLTSLSYSAVSVPEAPGQYRTTAAGLEIYLRGFERGAERHSPALVNVRVEHGTIAGVSTPGGDPIEDAAVEPEVIGRLIPGAPAERVEIRLADQKPYLIEGLLATEDRYFYWHPGINPVRIIVAAVEDLRAHRFAQGASTLTQQLARTFLERRERTLDRKFRELAVALVLEFRLTKDQILERYINDVSMGAYGGAPIHGMPQAARYFFNKDLSRVTPAEAATLIGMVQAPTLYDPRRHAEASKQRRDVVLGIMKREGVIDDDAWAEAVATPIRLTKPPGLRRAPNFTDYVITALRTGAGVSGDLAGLKVYTTLDAEIQAETVRALTSNLERLEKNYRGLRRTGKTSKLETAAVALDAHTGAIRAMVGGRNYSESQFNRAADALRQPGSAFKPLMYVAAMDPDRSPLTPPLTLSSLLPDRPMSFGGWSPENYEKTYEQQVTAIDALSESLNIPAAYVGSRLGPELIVRTAHELGIPQHLEPVLPIAIGAEETTLVDLTSAYQAFASGGMRSPAYSIESVADAAGHEIYRHESVESRVIPADVAYVMTGALKTVLKSGTGASAGHLGLDLPAAGKTGTTQDYKDAYFVGYTPDLVCGVWVGFDAPQSIGLTGAQAALPPWVQIMQHSAAAGARDFDMPPGIVIERVDPESGGLATSSCGKRVALPFLAGTEPNDYCPLHGGDGSAVASTRNWGGWHSTPPVAVARREEERPRTNVFSKVGKFFGSLFRHH